MTANTSFRSVIAKASTEGYAISLEESAKELVYDPESFMPGAIEDLALAPGHALFQVAQAVRVIQHALTFPTIDAYLDRSLAIMRRDSAVHQSRLFIEFDPLTRHQYVFQRHLGLALALEHEALDEILDGIECAMVRGDEALKLTEFVLGDGDKHYRLENFRPLFLTARSHWERLKAEAQVIGIYRPDGSVRSLLLMGLLFKPQLNSIIKLEIAAGNTQLIKAINNLDCYSSYFPGYIAPNIKNHLSLIAAHMEIPQIQAMRKEAGIGQVPDLLEIETRLEHYFLFLTCGHSTHEELIEYVLSANHDLDEILHRVLQFNFVSEIGFDNELHRKSTILDFAGAMRSVMQRDIKQALRIPQRALASFFAKGTAENLEMLQIDVKRILDAVAMHFTPEDCVGHPALLALCGSRPLNEYEDWCQGFDELGVVAEALYRVTGDQAYMITVTNFNTRARMFAGDLGI